MMCTLLFSMIGILVLAQVHGSPAARYDPTPSPKSVVQVGKARFTVLTSHLVRMEWGGSNDAATFAFVNRKLATPVFNVTKDGNWTIIQTPAVKVCYFSSSNGTFSAENLMVSIELNGKTVTWQPSPVANATLDGNLLGTIRSLDRVNGSIELDCHKQQKADLHCQLGLVSTQGYVVVDDTNHPQFDNSEWPWVINQTFPQPQPDSCAKVEPIERIDCGFLGISEFDCTGKGCCFDKSSKIGTPTCYYTDSSYQDLYFFGHGHDYKLALKEFTMVSGQIPIPPRYAFGVYYSRYHAYNDVGEMEIVREYERQGVPLDVLVLDMDWHITFYKEAAEGKRDQSGQRIGWSGFTWDSHLFPYQKNFLNWTKSRGLKVTLNVHPASGIQPWEDKYAEMALAMGIDPKSKKYVPFVPSDKKFVTNWFKIVMRARENEGVDFWWLDWGQGEEWIKIPLVNPTFWLNYIFYTNPYHWNKTSPHTRPLILHRWGGLGNHRYEVGFSGDVIPSWASLDFQVPFTLAATNVAFGYWSHDIGGHTTPTPPELYTRWVQWGVFSPIFRPHPGKLGGVRRIWLYPPENYLIMKEAFLLRESLVPYIYSNARHAYDEGLSLLRPMYYEYPECTDAYTFNKQYFFGPDILVAPVTHAVDGVTQMVNKTIWIPKGTYISWFTGESVTGPQIITRSFTLSEIPVYVRAGAILPLRTDDFARLGSAQKIPEKLKFLICTSRNVESGSTHLYEDDGVTTEYAKGQFANMSVSYKINSDNNTLLVTVGPTSGSFIIMPSARAYQIFVQNFWPADKVLLDGKEIPYVGLENSFASYSNDSWTYDGSTLSLIINIVSKQPVGNKVEVIVSYGSYKMFDPYWFQGFAGRLARLQQAKQILDEQWGVDTVYQEDYFGLLNATVIGNVITYDPTGIFTATQSFEVFFMAAIEEVKKLQKLDPDVKARVLAQLLSP